MQHWALVLSAYQYKVEHTPGMQNHCADCLSRLPSATEECDGAERVHVVVDTGQLPVCAPQIAKASQWDKTFSTVIKAVQHGRWPSKRDGPLLPYYNRRNDLTVVDGCLLLGSRVVIPTVFRSQLLDELHSNHVGACRMKMLARSYVWWPQLNSAIESLAKKCQQCYLSASAPLTAPAHPWLVPHGPWEHIHVDHAQWKNWLLLVAVDAFSKCD